jgi:hypothetical protein
MAIFVLFHEAWGGRAYPGHFIQTPQHVDEFNPVGYALDVLLPIVDLAEKGSWTPLATPCTGLGG